jgi:hypothetical protein
MLMSEFAISFERKARSHKSHHRLSKSHNRKHRVTEEEEDENSKKNKDYFLNVKNKWFALAAGFFIGISAGETSWMACLPKAWVNEVPQPSKDTKIENEKADLEKSDGHYKNMSPILKSIGDIIGKVGKAICWAHGQVITFIKLVIAGVKKFTEKRFRFKERSSLKITRRFRTEAQFEAFYQRATMEAVRKGHYSMSKAEMLRIFGWFDSAINAITDAFEAGKNAVFSTADQAMGFVSGQVQIAKDAFKKATEQLIEHAIKNYPEAVAVFQKIAEYLKGLAEQIQKLLQLPLFKRLQEIYKCWTSLKDFKKKTKQTIDAVLLKVKTVVEATAMLPPAGLAVIADILLACLCNYEKFAKAIGHFTTASAQTDPLKIYEFWGKGIGWFLQTVGSSETIKQNYDKALTEVAKLG